MTVIDSILKSDKPLDEKREALAKYLFKLHQDYDYKNMGKYLEKYRVLLDEASGGDYMKEVGDYVFLWKLECDNNYGLNREYLNHNILIRSAQLIESVDDQNDGLDVSLGNPLVWKFHSYADLAGGFIQNGRRHDGIEYYLKSLSYGKKVLAGYSGSTLDDKEKSEYEETLEDFRDTFQSLISAHKDLGDNEEQYSYAIGAFAPYISAEEGMALVDKSSEPLLKHDPIEDTDEYLDIKDELEEKLYKAFRRTHRGMGFCFTYWSHKRQILLEDYGIDWCPPSVMNPGVMFD